MPVNPDHGARLAGKVADLYAEAELVLLRAIAAATRQGIDSPTWELQALARVQWLRAQTRRTVTQLDVAAARSVVEQVVSAWNTGVALAVDDLPAGTVTRPVQPAKARAMAEATMADLRVATSGLDRLTERILRDAVNAGSLEVLGGDVTRRAAAQHVLDRVASSGITGFVDRAGRNWSLPTYAEMAVRTTAGQAAVQGHVDQLQDVGVDLVRVSDAPRECPLCRPWEGKVLSLSGQVGAVIAPNARGGDPVKVQVAGTLEQAQAAGLQHPNCFPGDVLVSAPSGVDAADSRWYEGELVVIHTAGGDELPVTPNHPVLTPEGWLAAGALEEGQRVLRYGARLGPEAAGRPDDEQVPARIGKVFDALREASPVLPVRMPSAAEQFHGDGTVDAQVEVVLADRFLQHHGVPSGLDEGSHGALLVGGMGLQSLLAESALGEVFLGAGHAADGVVSGRGQSGTLCRRHARETTLHGFAAGQGGVAVAAEPGREGRLSESDGGRSLALGLLSGQVTLDRVVEFRRRDFVGHVYNLQSGDGWYVASNIVVHNCRHSVSAFIPGATEIEQPQHDPSGYEAGQRQREMERHIRSWKRRKAVALDDETARYAQRKVTAWQSALREHVDAHQLKRLRYREAVGEPGAPLAR